MSDWSTCFARIFKCSYFYIRRLGIYKGLEVMVCPHMKLFMGLPNVRP